MTITQTPLDKQVVALDLSKGVDERTRPELIAGPNNVTTLENLVQDQTGAWVKRPGAVTGPVSDASGTGTYPASVRRVLSLVKGFGLIADGGKLLHYQDSLSAFRTRQQAMDFSAVSAAFIGSSGPQSQDSTFGAQVMAFASSSTHDAFIIRGGTTFPFTFSERLVLAERSTGVEYAYDLTSIYSPANQRHMCFVGNRYLHAYVSNGVTTKLIVIDTQSAIPTTPAGLTVVSVSGTYKGVYDSVGGTSYSYAALYDETGLVPAIFKYDGPGNFVSSYVGAGGQYLSISLNETAGMLWVANTVQIGAIDVASMAVSVAFTNTGSGFTTFSIAVNTTDNSLRVLSKSSTVIGGTTVSTFLVHSLPAGGGVAVTLVGGAYGWTPVSSIFFCPESGKYYCHMAKYDPTNELSSHALVDLSAFTALYSNSGASPPYGSFRVAGVIEPYVALRKAGVEAPYGTGAAQARSYHYATSSGEFSAVVTYQVAARTAGIGAVRFRFNDPGAFGSSNFCGSTYVAHGGLNQYDGQNMMDAGFVDQPIVDRAAAAGALAAGTYRYVAVYRHVDANGCSTYSRTFGPVSAVLGAPGANLIRITPPGVTNRDSGDGISNPVVDLYRTKSGGTQYFLCATSQQNVSASVAQQLAPSAVTGVLSVTDAMSDATLGTLAVMYRQPGTTNAPADRYSAPSCKFVVQHKDRLFCADPYGQRVYYSSFFVDGETAWFNPAFNFFVHQGAGPITALASMDGRLFIFKRDQIFVVDGDGPGESGPSGNEYSPPQALASSYGCIDHRSVAVTPDGIVFRSARGFELLNRSLQLRWIGDRVWSTAASNPITTGVCVDSDSRIHWTTAESENYLGSQTSGVELVYDMSSDSWSTAKYTGYNSTYGRARQGVGTAVMNGVSKLVYLDPDQGVFTTDTSYLDASGAYVPFKVESGWIRQGPQTRQRVSDVMLLAKRMSNHALKISLAYNYSSTYTQYYKWQPAAINAASIEELCIQPETEQILAIRIKVEDAVPDDTVTYPLGTGQGCDILGISAEIGAKAGIPKLPVAQKGGNMATDPVSPTAMALTMFQRSYSASPWNGTASAGVSGSRSMSEVTSPPTLGTALNGIQPAKFVRASANKITASVNNTSTFANNAMSLAILFRTTALQAASGADYGDGNLLGDLANAETTFGVHSGGVSACIYTGTYVRNTVACGTGLHLAQFKLDGVNLKVRVDSGAWQSTPCGPYTPVTPSPLVAGVGYAIGSFDGDIFEILASNTVLSDQDFDDIKTYLNTRYGVSL